MQEVSLFCGGNFADDATLVLLSYKQQGQSGRAGTVLNRQLKNKETCSPDCGIATSTSGGFSLF